MTEQIMASCIDFKAFLDRKVDVYTTFLTEIALYSCFLISSYSIDIQIRTFYLVKLNLDDIKVDQKQGSSTKNTKLIAGTVLDKQILYVLQSKTQTQIRQD